MQRPKRILNERDKILIEEVYLLGIGDGKMRDILGIHPYSAKRYLVSIGLKRTKHEQLDQYRSAFGRMNINRKISINELMPKFRPEARAKLEALV